MMVGVTSCACLCYRRAEWGKRPGLVQRSATRNTIAEV